MGNHLTQTAGVPAADIGYNRADDSGLNGTSTAGTPAVEDKIYYCAG
jgi:hypothetical protein